MFLMVVTQLGIELTCTCCAIATMESAKKNTNNEKRNAIAELKNELEYLAFQKKSVLSPADRITILDFKCKIAHSISIKKPIKQQFLLMPEWLKAEAQRGLLRRKLVDVVQLLVRPPIRFGLNMQGISAYVII
jgi:hypothetical protein